MYDNNGISLFQASNVIEIVKSGSFSALMHYSGLFRCYQLHLPGWLVGWLVGWLEFNGASTQ